MPEGWQVPKGWKRFGPTTEPSCTMHVSTPPKTVRINKTRQMGKTMSGLVGLLDALNLLGVEGGQPAFGTKMCGHCGMPVLLQSLRCPFCHKVVQ
jgi:hypothetical protein